MKSTKRNAVPRFWSIEIKKTKFVSSLFPGPHSKKESVPLIILLRDILKIADTKKEINQILNARQVLVDNTVRTDVRFPVGLFDSVAIPSLNLFYRVTFNKIGHINAVKIDKSESSEKLCKITGKRICKDKKVQITLNDGRNILIDNSKKYNTKDSLLISVPEQKILKHIPFEKSNLVFLCAGTHIGEIAVIKNFNKFEGPKVNRVMLKSKEGKEFETIEKYAFVIGEKEPVIKIEQK